MVIAMGYYSSALGVRAATAASAASSPDSSLRSSLLDGAHGVHGFRASSTMVTTNRYFEPLRNSCRPWRRELSVRRVERAMDFRVLASSSDETSGEKNGQVNTENVPGWAKPNSEEPPPWARNERPASQEPTQDIPFPVYLIGSTLVAIAAVGSVFEYFNQNPIFGVIPPDSPFYTPILGFFAISGLPTAGFLFYKSIQLANKASEEADKQDGFRR